MFAKTYHATVLADGARVVEMKTPLPKVGQRG